MEPAAAAARAPPPAAAAAVPAAETQPSLRAAAASPRRLLVLLGAKLCTWHLWKTIILGQLVSLFICGTAVTSQYLAEKYKVRTPMLHSFINYVFLCLVYTTKLAFRTGSDNLWQILRKRWWKYIFLGLVDVEANYMVVKAYQYTTLTSVQLLDCFGIPVLMALSWYILRARYKIIHFVAVALCLLGVGTMVGADILSGREEGEGNNVLIGDILVLLGASLYAVSNVSEEYIVKNLSRLEFLGMVGLFGTIISGLQLPAVHSLCHVHVCAVQLHASCDRSYQCNHRQPGHSDFRSLQPLLWPFPVLLPRSMGLFGCVFAKAIIVIGKIGAESVTTNKE